MFGALNFSCWEINIALDWKTMGMKIEKNQWNVMEKSSL